MGNCPHIYIETGVTTDMKRLFFFGDSICFGQGVSIHKGWVPRIASGLELDLSFKVDVINAAVNGNNTRQALERMPYELQSQEPDAILVQFGMNDCNHWETDHGLPRVSPDAFRANMIEITTRALHFGAKCVFVNTNHPTTRTNELLPGGKSTYQQNNEAYNRILREAIGNRDNEVLLIDVERHFFTLMNKGADLANLLLPDGLHLSEQGHDVYFDFVYPIILNVLRSKLS